MTERGAIPPSPEALAAIYDGMVAETDWDALLDQRLHHIGVGLTLVRMAEDPEDKVDLLQDLALEVAQAKTYATYALRVDEMEARRRAAEAVLDPAMEQTDFFTDGSE